MGHDLGTVDNCEIAQPGRASLRALPADRCPAKDQVMHASIAASGRSPASRRALYQTPALSSHSRNTYSIFLLLMVLAIEGVVVLVVIHDLHHSYLEVVEIYEPFVRGLWRIGEVQYEAQETRRATMYALTTNNANLQVAYADQSREADSHVTEGIDDFVARAQSPEERNVGLKLSNDWKRYLMVRNEVLGLILEASIQQAVDLDVASGAPQFETVRQDL